MKHNFLKLLFILALMPLFGQANKVSVDKATNGMRLKVDGKDFIILLEDMV